METENNIEVLVVSCKMPKLKRRVTLTISLILSIMLIGRVPNFDSISKLVLGTTLAIVSAIIFAIICTAREIYRIFEPSTVDIYNESLNIEGYEPRIVEAELIEPNFYNKLYRLDNIIILQIMTEDRRRIRLYLKDEDGTLKSTIEARLKIK